MNLPIGFRINPVTNLDILYVFNSRLHFRKIVNGYSGGYPPGYKNLIRSLNISSIQRSQHFIKKFNVDYLIYHFDFYENPEKTKQQYIKELAKINNINFITNFGNNYIYKIVYD